MLIAVKSIALGDHTVVHSLKNVTLQIQCYSEKFERFSWGIMVTEEQTENILFSQYFDNEPLRTCLHELSVANPTWHVFRSLDFVENVLEVRLRESSNLENEFNL